MIAGDALEAQRSRTDPHRDARGFAEVTQMEERKEQFECSFCGEKFNFKKDAETHERECPKRQ